MGDRAETTLDEPVSVTLKRELRNIGDKMYKVVLPSSKLNSSSELRNCERLTLPLPQHSKTHSNPQAICGDSDTLHRGIILTVGVISVCRGSVGASDYLSCPGNVRNLPLPSQPLIALQTTVFLPPFQSYSVLRAARCSLLSSGSTSAKYVGKGSSKSAVRTPTTPFSHSPFCPSPLLPLNTH